MDQKVKTNRIETMAKITLQQKWDALEATEEQIRKRHIKDMTLRYGGVS